MAYCRNCGKEISDNDKFCASCGEPTHDGFETAKKTAQEKFNEINDTNDYTAEYDEKDIEDNKLISIFAYLGILILAPVLAGKDSRFAKFHVAQGVNLIVAYVAYSVVSAILAVFLWIPVVSELINIAIAVVGFVLFILVVIGIVNVLNGKAKELPIIGSWNILKRI